MAKKKTDDTKDKGSGSKDPVLWGFISKNLVNDILALLEPEQGKIEDWLGPKLPGWLKSPFMERVLGFIRRRIENVAEEMDNPILGPVIEKATDMTFRAANKGTEEKEHPKVSVVDWQKEFYQKAMKEMMENPSFETEDRLREEFFKLKSFNKFFERETKIETPKEKERDLDAEWKEFQKEIKNSIRKANKVAKQMAKPVRKLRVWLQTQKGAKA